MRTIWRSVFVSGHRSRRRGKRLKSSGAALAVMHPAFLIVAAVEPNTMNEKTLTRAAKTAREPSVAGRPAEGELPSHQEMLVRELEHRTLNILQIIASMISIKSRTAQSEETRRDLED